MRRNEKRTLDELVAIHAYYTALANQSLHAIGGDASVPEIPPPAELDLVDGWIVWKGRPVWSGPDSVLAGTHPVRMELYPDAARSAWIEASEIRLDITQEKLTRTAEHVRHGNKPPEHKARVLAEIGLYGSLMEQHRRAIHGKASTPALPAESELEFVDGWLVWKGQRVWWSGYRSGSQAGNGADHPPTRTAALPRPAAEARPGWRHLFRLPWQRAA
jgi:hypothetical protein